MKRTFADNVIHPTVCVWGCGADFAPIPSLLGGHTTKCPTPPSTECPMTRGIAKPRCSILPYVEPASAASAASECHLAAYLTSPPKVPGHIKRA
jgi:hypothetical protein